MKSAEAGMKVTSRTGEYVNGRIQGSTFEGTITKILKNGFKARLTSCNGRPTDETVTYTYWKTRTEESATRKLLPAEKQTRIYKATGIQGAHSFYGNIEF